jgi:DNA polymerase elongation subunit (family B)
VKTTNATIAVEIMRLIILHAPAFTVGHNVYAFDNTVLAKALPKGHTYTHYFQMVQKSDSKVSTTLGLIMTIPGINNIDTYKYIYHSMNHVFKAFSLQYLCNTLDLGVGKLDSTRLRFCKQWYSSSFANALEMTHYNMRDCEATLALCEIFDMINPIVALCYGAKAWIWDVALYNTGAMSLSSMCAIAWDRGYRYNWTRCDWIPDVFTGGQVLFTGERVQRNVAILDFMSMYPSIICDGGISPECIDFIDYNVRHTPRFSYVHNIYAYSYDSSRHIVCVGCIALGKTKGWDIDAEGMVLVGECAAAMPCNVAGMDTIASTFNNMFASN